MSQMDSMEVAPFEWVDGVPINPPEIRALYEKAGVNYTEDAPRLTKEGFARGYFKFEKTRELEKQTQKTAEVQKEKE